MVVTRQLSGERLFQAANYVLLSVVALLFAFPIYNVLVNSFVGNLTSAAARVNLLPPRDATLDAYRMLLGGSGQIVRAYGITLFRVVAGTLLNMLVTVLLSYGLSKTRLPYVKGITFFIFFTILFSGGLIPTYFLVRSLGLIDTVWSLVIPILVSPWYALLLRNFFFSIPAEIEESAVMDGAHPLQIVVRIVIPLSMAAISTIALFYAVLHWNSWVDAVIYINSSRKWAGAVDVAADHRVRHQRRVERRRAGRVRPDPAGVHGAVCRDHRHHRADSAGVSLHSEVLREGRDGRIGEGLTCDAS